MSVLAWLYMSAPKWAVSLLPRKINDAESGQFNQAVQREYDRRVRKDKNPWMM